MDGLIERATKNLRDTLEQALCVMPSEHALVIYDAQAPLTRIMVEAYRRALPSAKFVAFESTLPEQVLALFNELKPKDLVVLVQSMNFRLNEFRLRIELFQRGLKTIEHIHLARLEASQFGTYVDALAYDADTIRPLGRALKQQLDACTCVTVECEGTKLVYDTGMEDTKMNVGDYSEMKNVGGTFPIGEVFTEAKDLTRVNGDVKVFGFAGEDHIVRLYESFPVHIEQGILTAPEGPEDFQRILDLIREDEAVLVREFGLGLNKAMGKHALVNDITAFERQHGLHFSLGAKHAMYPKPGLKRKEGRYHVDIFIDVQKICVDEKVIFENGGYTIRA